MASRARSASVSDLGRFTIPTFWKEIPRSTGSRLFRKTTWFPGSAPRNAGAHSRQLPTRHARRGNLARLHESFVEGEGPPPVQDGDGTVIFWRSYNQSIYRHVEEDERLALIGARQVKKFGDICDLLAFQSKEENVTQRLAGFLPQWFSDGLIARVSSDAPAVGA